MSGGGDMNVRQGAAQVMLKGAIKTIPVIPGQTFLALFERKLRGITYPEGREFLTKLLLMVKKALSSTSTRKAATKALEIIMALAFDAGCHQSHHEMQSALLWLLCRQLRQG
jgi:hypothetical protein